MLYKTKFPMGVHSSLDCALSPAVIRAASCSAAGPVAGSAANRAADTGGRWTGIPRRATSPEPAFEALAAQRTAQLALTAECTSLTPITDVCICFQSVSI